MKKICVVIASRANYGRIKSVLLAIKNHPYLELQIIVSASAMLYRFGKVIDIIEKDGFIINSKLYSIVEGENPTTMAKSVGLSIIELSTQFESLKPDYVITVADRYETIATAIAASFMNIKVAHTQGGEITGSIDESVRHSITKLSHIHFPATEKSKNNLIRMGENPKYIFNVGCPSIDELIEINLNDLTGLLEKYGGVGGLIDLKAPYLVVLQHPVTTEFDNAASQINKTLAAIKKINMQTIWLWPNIDAGSDEISKSIRMFRERNKNLKIHFYRNFEIHDYAKLINSCSCLVGNSSSGIREGAYLGVPVVNIGNRQQFRERFVNVIDVPNDENMIFEAILKQLKHGKYKSSNLYGDGTSGIKIAEILANEDPPIQKILNYEI